MFRFLPNTEVGPSARRSARPSNPWMAAQAWRARGGGADVSRFLARQPFSRLRRLCYR
ncbi:MAG: hypothetical protein MZU91_10710 [Desulfosudis oleivorans]|nr:hypothetical protein [Desulfosudis oleivorans]